MHRTDRPIRPLETPSFNHLVMATRLALAALVVLLASASAAQDGADPKRQWISGRVLTSGAAVDLSELAQLADGLEQLGSAPAPGTTTVELLRVVPRYQRLLAVLGDEASAPVATASVGSDGRFTLRTPSAGPWQLRVRAHGFVSMEYFVPPLPVQLDVPTVWLQPVVRESVAYATVESAWVSSMHSESAIFDMQRLLGGWQRQPVRAWSRALHDGTSAVRVDRGRDETLGLLWQEAQQRDALFLVAEGRNEGRFADAFSTLVVEQRGEPVAESVHLVAAGEETVPLHEVVITLDGRPTGRTDHRGVLEATVLEGAEVEAVAPDGSWGRVLALPRQVVDRRLVVEMEPAVPMRLNVRGASGGVLRDAVLGVAVDGAVAKDSATDEGGLTLWLGASTVRSNLESARAETVFSAEVAAIGYLPAPVEQVGLAGRRRVARDVVMLRAADAVGKVVDRSGHAVPHADLVAVPTAAPEASPQWARSDEDGLFRLQQLQPATRYALFALHPDYPIRPIGFVAPAAGERRQDLVVELFRPFDASGRVVTEDGHPATGATVRLRGMNRASGRSTLVLAGAGESARVELEARTDDLGFFAFPDTETGNFDVLVSMPGAASVFVPSRALTVENAVLSAGRYKFDLGTFQLVPEVVVPVQVVDQDSTPVAPGTAWWTGVTVPRSSPTRFATRSPFNQRSREAPWHSAELSDDGLVLLTGTEPSAALSIVVQAPGFVTRQVNELVVDWHALAGADPQSVEPIVVQMVQASSVMGVVEDHRGRPIHNAHVSVHPLAQQADFPVGLFVRTGEDGEFSLDGMPPGAMRVMANAVDAAVIEPVDLVLEAGTDVTDLILRAPQGAVVSGLVLASGAPLSGATVVSDSRAATTDLDGHFSIEHVRVGHRSVEVRRHPGSKKALEVRPGDNWIELDATQADEVEAEAERIDPSQRFSVSGTVLTDQADLSARREALQVLLRGQRIQPLQVDEDGSFLMEDLRPGRYLLTASLIRRDGRRRARAETVHIEDRDVEGVVIDLRSDAYGELRIRTEGLQPTDLDRLVRFGLPVRIRRIDEEQRGSSSGFASASGQDGDFVLDELTAGRVELDASVADGLYRAQATAEVFGGSATDIVLYFERQQLERISGVLTVNGAPSAGWIVARAESAAGFTRPDAEDMLLGSQSAQANALGQFEITLEPGRTSFLVSVAHRAIGSFSAYAEPETLLRLDVQHQVLRGRVQNADGSALPNIQLTAHRSNQDSGYAGRTEVGPDGRFELHTLTLGEPVTLRLSSAQRLLMEYHVANSAGEILVTLPP